jgi:hypothetical protein
LFVIAFWQREDCWIVSRAESKRSAQPLARKILTYLPEGIEIRLREYLMGSIFQHSASLTPLDQSEYISPAVVITTTSHSTNTDETSDEKSGGLL